MFKGINKRKTKLIMAIFSLTLAFSFMTIGVYAVVERQMAINGKLTFSSTSVDATITVSRAVGVGSYTTVDSVSFSSGGGSQAGKEVSLGTMAFSDTTTTVKYKVLIEVDANARPASLVFADSGNLPNQVSVVATKKIGAGTPSNLAIPNADTIASIAGGSSVEYEFIYTINPKTSANFDAANAIISTFTLTRT